MQAVHQVSANEIGMDYSRLRVGASLVLVAICYIVLLGLIPINIYHAFVFLDNVLVNPNSSGFLTYIVPVVAVALSLLEIPLTKMLITEVRVNCQDGKTGKFYLLLMFSALILLGTTVGAYNSQMASALTVDNQLTQHATTTDNFQNKKNALKAQWESSKLFARKLENGGAAELQRANKKYYDGLAALGDQKAAHQGTKPAKTMETGSTGHIIVIMVVGLLCSLGVMLITAFLTIFRDPLIAIPMAVITGDAKNVEQDVTTQLIPVTTTYLETTRVCQMPEWIDAAIQTEHNGVPIYALETETGYKVAILSPDKQRVLFLHETITEDQMARDLSDKGAIHREFADQIAVYKSLDRKQLETDGVDLTTPQGVDLTSPQQTQPVNKAGNGLPAGMIGGAGLGLSIGEDGISPTLGLGAGMIGGRK